MTAITFFEATSYIDSIVENEDSDSLTTKEVDFLEGLARRAAQIDDAHTVHLSDKQAEWLGDLYYKVTGDRVE